MTKYLVTAIWSQRASVEVEAESEEEAEDKGYDLIENGKANFDTEVDDIPDIEVEIIDD